MLRVTRDTSLYAIRDNKLMPTRVCNILLRGGCDTVGDVVDKYTRYELVFIPNLGPEARNDIEEFLKDNLFVDENGEESTVESENDNNMSEYLVSSNGMTAKILISGGADSKFLDLVKLTLNQALDDEKEKLKLREFEANPLNAKLVDVRPELSARSLNCLLRAGYKTVGDVMKLTEEELGSLRNIGMRGKEEIIERFSVYGDFAEKEG